MSVSWRSLTGAVFDRDFAVARRSGGGWFYALLFFGVFSALAGIAIGPELSALKPAAPAVIWLGAAFAVLLVVADIFEGDFRDGFLRAFAAEQESLVSYFAAKFLLVFATAAAPMIIAAPLILTMFGVGPEKLAGAAFLLALGLPALVLTAMFASALAAGLRAGGMLAVVVAAPFLAPPLIFGALSVEAYIANSVLWSPEALILTALSLFMAALSPVFSIMALRLGLE